MAALIALPKQPIGSPTLIRVTRGPRPPASLVGIVREGVTDDCGGGRHAVRVAAYVPLVQVLVAAGSDEGARLVGQDAVRVEVVAPVREEAGIEDGDPDTIAGKGALVLPVDEV